MEPSGKGRPFRPALRQGTRFDPVAAGVPGGAVVTALDIWNLWPGTTVVIDDTLPRGSVGAATAHREFGHAVVNIGGGASRSRMFTGVPDSIRVWASHGDHVATAPAGFSVVATSASVPVAAMEDASRGCYALLFHPEVVHTEQGAEILRNFAFNVCGCTGDWTMASFIEESIARIREKVGDGKVVCGLSGGVDSTVAALLVHKAIGDRLTCIFVDNGLLRLNEAAQIVGIEPDCSNIVGNKGMAESGECGRKCRLPASGFADECDRPAVDQPGSQCPLRLSENRAQSFDGQP